jgi:3'-5' exonuclease
MKTETHNTEPRIPRSWVVFDIESAVIDDTGHRRYQATERWTPSDEERPSRRGYTRSEDPLKTPRWIFQTITTACAMVLTEHQDGNVDVARFVTLSAPEHDERQVVEGLLKVLADAPADADLASWAGSIHDLPMLVCAAMRHGLTLPAGWKWMAFGGDGRQRHIDFARVATANMKMKPIHEAELLAAFDIPAKLSAPAFAVARLIETGQWDIVQAQCEGDVTATALLLARWRKLHDPRCDADVAEDRILRRVCELRAGRGYIAALEAHRARRFRELVEAASNDAEVLAPWLDICAA